MQIRNLFHSFTKYYKKYFVLDILVYCMHSADLCTYKFPQNV